jgi:hypothetical protein
MFFNLQKISRNTFDCGFLKEESLIHKKLPADLFKFILSFLDNDLNSIARVSKLWYKTILITLVDKETYLIKYIIKLINGKLEPTLNTQLKLISDRCDQNKIFNYINRLQFKSSMMELKVHILNVLKELKKEDLEKFEKLMPQHTPSVFDSIFRLAKIYQEIDAAEKMSNARQKLATFQSICKKLVRENEMDHALEIVGKFDDNNDKLNTLHDLHHELLKQNKINKIVKISNMMDQLDTTSGYFYLVKSLKLLDIRETLENINSLTSIFSR